MVLIILLISNIVESGVRRHNPNPNIKLYTRISDIILT